MAVDLVNDTSIFSVVCFIEMENDKEFIKYSFY